MPAGSVKSSSVVQIPGYKIKRELGHGGMATVYLAEQTSLEREIALKIMAPALAADRTFTRRFIKEGKTIAKFSHPHIVSVYDVGVVDQHHYIAMQYISGGDLKRKMSKEGAIEPKQALQILSDIASALGYAHKQGFIHRDVKSENILFREDQRAVLTDFGIVKAADSGTRMTGTGMSIGTPHYMSPEQARGKEVDGRSDLYSLGIVFYEALTGRVPFQGEDSVAIGIMHVSEPIPELPEEFSVYKPLMQRLLAKDPAARYQNTDQLMQAIEAIKLVLKTGQAPALQRPPSKSRTRAMMLGIGTAAALAGAGGVYYFSTNQPTLGPATQPTEDQVQLEQQPVVPLSVGNAILQVDSDPPGAEVLVNGNLVGTTPFYGENLPPGQHLLEVKHLYSQVVKQTVTLTGDAVLKRDIKLVPGIGDLTVLSEPSGAQIFIDDKLMSERTPATLKSLQAGKRSLRLQLDQYHTKEAEVEVLPEHTARFSAELKGGDLISVGSEWVEPDQAAEAFLVYAKQMAERGDVTQTRAALDKAREFGAAARAEQFSANYLALAQQQQESLAKVKAQVAAARGRGDAALAAYQRDAAITAFREAVKIDPQDPELGALLEQAQSLYKVGEVFRDRVGDGWGPEMIVVPAGEFQMGSSDQEPGRDTNEGPRHLVKIARPFAVSRFEITFEEFDWFAETTGRALVKDRGWGRGRRPAINLSWSDAVAYTKWLSRATGKEYRLPSEAEWEYAARAGSDTQYWWGDQMTKDKGNCDGCVGEWEERKTVAVGSYPANTFGLHDVVGNVFEWTADCYNNSYDGAPSDGSAWLEGNCGRRVFRGGSWYYGPRYARSAFRNQNARSYRSSNVGMRLVRVLR